MALRHYNLPKNAIIHTGRGSYDLLADYPLKGYKLHSNVNIKGYGYVNA